MARRLARGDICLYRFSSPDKTRPIVVLTRNSVIRFLNNVMVAPVTSTIRGIPSEVIIGQNEGLKHPSAVNLDNIQTVPITRLSERIGRLDPQKLRDLRQALAVATGCDWGGIP